MNLLIDENVSHRIVERLRLDEHTLTLAQDVAASRQDTDVLALAQALGAIVLTEDTDFGELVMHQHLPSAGVILLRLSGVARTAQPEHVARALAAHAEHIPGSFTVIAPAGFASVPCRTSPNGPCASGVLHHATVCSESGVTMRADVPSSAGNEPVHHERQDERAKVDAIRQELPATLAVAYLNAGTNGPLPHRSHDTLVAFDHADLVEGRIGTQGFSRYLQSLTDAREAVADLLGCQPLDVALTHNTTEGVNIALMGLDWRPGDEVITGATEHPGVLHPVYLLRQRFGVRIRMTEIGTAERDPLAELRRTLTPRTRAVVVSHVSWTSGMVLPMREMADLAHHHGALLIADAAQSCGMVPSAVYELGVDAYACSGQKWLCGPNGTGALFVRPDRLGDIQQTFMGYGSIHHGMSDHEGHFVPAPGAKRFESAALYPAGVKAFETGLRWLREDVGWEWIYQRIATLGRYCYEALAEVDGVTLLTPRDHMAGLVHFNREGIPPADLAARLAEAGIVVRSTPHPPAVRASLGFYNTEEEVDRLVVAVRALQTLA